LTALGPLGAFRQWCRLVLLFCLFTWNSGEQKRKYLLKVATWRNPSRKFSVKQTNGSNTPVLLSDGCLCWLC
jgi:hypothetical protein